MHSASRVVGMGVIRGASASARDAVLGELVVGGLQAGVLTGIERELHPVCLVEADARVVVLEAGLDDGAVGHRLRRACEAVLGGATRTVGGIAAGVVGAAVAVRATCRTTREVALWMPHARAADRTIRGAGGAAARLRPCTASSAATGAAGTARAIGATHRTAGAVELGIADARAADPAIRGAVGVTARVGAGVACQQWLYFTLQRQDRVQGRHSRRYATTAERVRDRRGIGGRDPGYGQEGPEGCSGNGHLDYLSKRYVLTDLSRLLGVMEWASTRGI